MKKIIVVISLMIIIVFSACSSSKEIKEKNTKDITVAIDSSRWSFVPIRMIPLGDRSRETFGGYSVSYSEKKLNVYLPYYGTAYMGADVLSTTGPLDFVSKDFAISKQQKKAGQWDIIVKPNDNKEVRSLNFTLYDNGSATLNVTMQNRSPISFTGNVEPLKNKE